MSDSPVPAPLRETTIRVTDETLLSLFGQREALGFHSENALMAVAVAALSKVPPDKFFEALAKITAYHRPAPKKKGAK